MCEVSILRITILVEHISPHSLYAYTTLSARQAGEIKLILENTATWKHWKIRMGNIKIKSILCNTATWKYWKIYMENIEIKSILENTATWKYWKIYMGNIEIKSISENTGT